jgi:uncharacterized protein (DUF58 family)
MNSFYNFIAKFNANDNYTFEYMVGPVDRGEYYFGYLNICVSSGLKIVKRKYQFQNQQMLTVHPSIIQMQKYDFLAISNALTQIGLKKIRRFGNTSEFEQLKEYLSGDDFRTVN